jgi:hypothetical protein
LFSLRTAAACLRAGAVIPRVVWMTGCCSVRIDERMVRWEVKTIEQNDKGRDGKVPAEEMRCTVNAADASSGGEPRRIPLCTDSGPGAASGTGQEDENKELEWARRHVPEGPDTRAVPHLPRPPGRQRISQQQPKKQPVQQKSGPSKPKQEVFRKTELHTRPPLATGGEATGVTRYDLPGAEEISDLFPSGSPEWIRLLLKRQDDVSDDLYRQVAKVEDHLETLYERLGQVTGRLDRRVADLEERGRWR